MVEGSMAKIQKNGPVKQTKQWKQRTTKSKQAKEDIKWKRRTESEVSEIPKQDVNQVYHGKDHRLKLTNKETHDSS